MPILVERRLFKTGEGGFAITLPKAWVNYHRLKYGDRVEIEAEMDLTIRVKPRPEDKTSINSSRLDGHTDTV